jgi:ubiquinone/menaquinone biosynthesis C-methylase UbiE
MYRVPGRYHREIEHRFGDTRRRAFEHFVESRADALGEKRTCLDVACGTGLTTLWLASALPQLQIVGVDASGGMLRRARREARRLGLESRCSFAVADMRNLTPADLRKLVPSSHGGVDIVTCALGLSVVDEWQEAFANTARLVAPDGFYVVFDQFSPGEVVYDFAADQSRESWKLVESTFVDSETTWYGREFIAIGQHRRTA